MPPGVHPSIDDPHYIEDDNEDEESDEYDVEVGPSRYSYFFATSR
jgi:hypothetical protein